MSHSKTAIENPVTLATLDSPPTHCVVPRSHLISISPFFKDTLEGSLKSDSGDGVVITLTESYNEVKGFFMVLKGEETGLENLRQDDWLKLVKCAHKYDCHLARIVVERHLWRQIAEGKYAEAFSLAVELRLLKAIQKTWREAVDKDNELSRLQDVSLKRIMLTAFKKRRKIAAETLRETDPDCSYDTYCECEVYMVEYTWMIAAHTVNYGYKASLSVEHQLQEAINQVLKNTKWALCRSCITDMLKMGKRIDSHLTDELNLNGW